MEPNKMEVDGRLVSFSIGLFLGSMLVSGLYVNIDDYLPS